ncbi:phosphopantetheine-binding protein [Streptomyces cynarae]|uniref:Phosphopantetheine-binding protein n=1 Tax=Streptomyces cynarae TaxID=2981134 RepID=A0ABY6EDF8_9ACTN|nr:Pls/PosA family non-ribosomal peptide synthetase [Streptomyces cynarae]UXY23933.1 phosphopantetheine-binding protein [Streptomyces cynarae]
MEQALAQVLAEVVGIEQVPADSHFFDDLGADSLVMAHFCARLRKRADLPSVSMKEIYQHPTIRSLAAAVPDTAPTRTAPAFTQAPGREPQTATGAPPGDTAGTTEYVLCGILQALAFLGYTYLAAMATAWGYEWISARSDLLAVYVRSVLFGGAVFVGLCALPILVKWTLIGRWKPGQIRIWSLGYVRFWVVRTLIRTNPLTLFVGSPLYVFYLRALGADIGRGAVILSRNVPVCTDLLTIGEGSVVRKDSFFLCYRARAGVIEPGPVTIGKSVLVSEATVMDIGTALGDGAQLGHASSLHSGQVVPQGERWHGSPAQRTEADFQVVGETPHATLRRALHSARQLATAFLVYVPLAVGGTIMLLVAVPELHTVIEPGPAVLTNGTFYRDVAVAAAVLVLGGLILGLLLVSALPRVLRRAVVPGRDYPLYGWRHSIHRAVSRLTNRRNLTRLFGDSSCIVHYLRAIGYDFSHIEQTGSNFGTEVRHETPFMSSVGSGTMVADGLSIVNADFSSTAFQVSRASIGAHSFLGNRIAYPARARTGDNCLLATKVMVPVDGQIREGVGLLGSPSFEIPRTVLRDSRFDRFRSGEELRRGLAAKNKHNAATMGWFLLSRWIYLTCAALLAAGAADTYARLGVPAVALADVLVVVFTAVYFVLVERLVIAARRPGALYCSIYDPRFWWRERYWKVPSETYLRLFNGTPFKNVIWRLLGVRIGHRVFDDGCYVTERPMVTIGDACILNAGSIIQCHSQEDGTFKSESTTLGRGCTIGVGALVHYGVTLGDGAVLAADSFLMKGEVVPQNSRWGGNPARELEQGDDDVGRSSR